MRRRPARLQLAGAMIALCRNLERTARLGRVAALEPRCPMTRRCRHGAVEQRQRAAEHPLPPQRRAERGQQVGIVGRRRQRRFEPRLRRRDIAGSFERGGSVQHIEHILPYQPPPCGTMHDRAGVARARTAC